MTDRPFDPQNPNPDSPPEAVLRTYINGTSRFVRRTDRMLAALDTLIQQRDSAFREGVKRGRDDRDRKREQMKRERDEAIAKMKAAYIAVEKQSQRRAKYEDALRATHAVAAQMADLDSWIATKCGMVTDDDGGSYYVPAARAALAETSVEATDGN